MIIWLLTLILANIKWSKNEQIFGKLIIQYLLKGNNGNVDLKVTGLLEMIWSFTEYTNFIQDDTSSNIARRVKDLQ